ncbi:murein DD-endopeptidase MepM/ murein hydrolase activator NlpD [Bradyrhizobium sp. GM2.2]|jgi:murein DD-endopeptidase MepM/ murein hydrolase activator NlpD|uniref:LysM peptidoglycan-binding domain-containing M23 family metallopeptidase n=1 Tax=Bradyrhizobium TaxID=374 RepID=UPI00195C8B63|nr:MULTISPECIES: LysM peptidoglycan-binding domain-containing M23 family metallopeptidase [Bradyrhizobium]MBM7482824.1 murein DD-endopeptidase MepM/ murein hydrolase activator NlpD [Bradyrhizobium canariense]MCK1269968.1 LysM peptidoglycan-binding domain-containing M23 family metallopeptidase [Bradyrhizobium sp. 84]MCK1292389.1 LysM peptidoglycan-binding domain-containing M23 family metallopeptidase [Bradyrhizobium sp. 30]MCK1313880.1 LysM peptidoglycan-binding domain-containing M23 family meta
MSVAAELLYSRRVPQVAVLALISFSFAGCSADMSSRMSQSNFSNPFAQESTGSVQQAPPPQRELPQYSRPQTQSGYYQSQPLPPAVSTPQSYPVAAGGVSGGGRGVGSYAPPAQPHLETTATVPPRSVAAAQPVGGTKIIVGTSDTLDLLAKRYRVTPQAILAANGYKGPRALSPGQQLIIPHQATAAAPAPLMAPVAAAPAPAAKPVAAVAAPSSTHFVNHGDTLASIARKNHISAAELARANGLDPSAKLKLGARLAVPGAKTAAVAAPLAAAPVGAAPVAGTLQPVAAAPAPATKMAAVAAPVQSARLAQATANVEDKAADTPAKAAETTSALPTFRWPVRGKVVTSYGAKTNGKSNDGINLAVPEGTPVKAAEDGVVAYSGNELKGYGNLVLVRHSNGYVTAYAHASELMVKRGDTIKRGQVIAKSGQSGEVASPQLHFEIRKGSSPVDPLQFLNGA